jgi:hypothetical protein
VAFAGVRFRRRILGAECLADHEQKNELLHGVLYEDGTICGRLVALAATPRERDRAGCSIVCFRRREPIDRRREEDFTAQQDLKTTRAVSLDRLVGGI